MKTIIKNIVLCVILCTMVACDSWLDTTPPSQVPEEDQFDDEFGFRQISRPSAVIYELSAIFCDLNGATL